MNIDVLRLFIGKNVRFNLFHTEGVIVGRIIDVGNVPSYINPTYNITVQTSIIRTVTSEHYISPYEILFIEDETGLLKKPLIRLLE